jgi:hypothetical protein
VAAGRRLATLRERARGALAYNGDVRAWIGSSVWQRVNFYAKSRVADCAIDFFAGRRDRGALDIGPDWIAQISSRRRARSRARAI